VCCSAPPPRRTVQGWCGWKRTLFAMQPWALSATFSSAPRPWSDCSLSSWKDEVPLSPATCSRSMSVQMLHCPFPSTHFAGDRPRTSYNGEAACSRPRRGWISYSCNTAWDQSELCTALSWLQYGKGFSVWISSGTLAC
jgi:hypothetical protein